MTRKLNEFTGIRTETLKRRLRKLEERLKEMRKSVADGEELGGGSPFESIYDQIDDLESEIDRREYEERS